MNHTWTIREMKASDYDSVMELWEGSAGIGLSAADSRAGLTAYLERNPGCSFVAVQSGQMVGAVLSGHDGRRGYLHHLAVSPAARRHGLGRLLVQCCLDALRSAGIDKAHIFVFHTNEGALHFWTEIGFFRRPELVLMSTELN